MTMLSTDKFEAEMLRSSYYRFFLWAWSIVSAEPFKNNWHIEKLCNEIQTVSERVFAGQAKEYDLITNCPPGSTKSKIFSVCWHPWAWARMPSSKTITGSYSERLSLELGRQSRDIVTSGKYRRLFPDIELRDDQNTKGFYMNTKGGWRFSTGVGGSVTGFHAHFIVVDDPINPDEAFSDLDLATANTWMTETLSDRKVDKEISVVALVMQRLHQDDPTGHWLHRGGRLRHLCLPCDDTWTVLPNEWRQYYMDGLFDCGRFPRSPTLEEAEARGEAYYAGQYGQQPVPRGGGMFKVERLLYSGIVPAKWKRGPMRFWDKASTRMGGAFTAGVKMAIDMADRTWILDVARGQWDSGTREGKIIENARKDGKLVKVGLEQEPGGSGKESAEHTARRITHSGFRCWINPVRGDKEERAEPLSVQVNIGNVVLVPTWWNKDFVEEMRYFPVSRYKDQIDAASGCYNGLARARIRIGAL